MKLLIQKDFRKVWQQKDGIHKIEVFDAGTGKKYDGTPAVGHWKTRGYKDPKSGAFAVSLRELKEKIGA